MRCGRTSSLDYAGYADTPPPLPSWRWGEDWGGVRARRRLPPFPLDTVDRRRDDENHQRDLEVEVDELDAGLREQREAVVVRIPTQRLRHELCDDPDRAERRDEREGERDAGEVGGNAGERRERAAHPTRCPVADRRVRDQQSEAASEKRRDEADLDAVLVRGQVGLLDQLRDVVHREATVLPLEGADNDLSRGQKQEQESIISPFFLLITFSEMIKDALLEEGFEPSFGLIVEIEFRPGVLRWIADLQLVGMSMEFRMAVKKLA